MNARQRVTIIFMKYLKQKPGTFYCFSPPVMIATFFIEIALGIIALTRYKLSDVTKLSAAILGCLAIFQLAEYNICEGAFGLDSLAWARLGFVSITLLPPLGLHLATKLAKNKQSVLVASAYTAAAAFAGFFLFVGHGLTGPACMGNYVMFSIAEGAGGMYRFYYYGLLIMTTAYALFQAKKQTKPNRARSLVSLAVGYIAFIVPTTAVNFMVPATRDAIPSVMCGFAVLLALILSGRVLPEYHKQGSFVETIRKRFSFGG